MFKKFKFFCLVLGLTSITLVSHATKPVEYVNPNIVTFIQSTENAGGVVNEEVTSEVQETSAETPRNIGNIIQSILLSLLFLAILAHMVFELFIRKKPYSKDGYTVEDMKQARAESGKSAEMSQGECTTINNLLNEATSEWTEHNGSYFPTNIKQVRNLENAIAQAAEMMPTDAAIIERLNEMVTVLNDLTKRQFNGSVKLIVLTVVMAIFLTFMAGWTMIPFFVFSLAVYYGASLTPTWMLVKKEISGNGGKAAGASRFIAGIFSFIGSAQTIRTVTKWSDGTVTKEDDHTQHFVAIIIGIVLFVFLALFISIWGIFNYFRNYVIYK
ncbi:MAG: hypothetical protein MJZ53_06725 [Paludibacteraceae bacterium]|nr:hypothetical protein [Paludibacteraceae bacterium]